MSGVLDEDNLADSVWAISYLSETQKSKIQRVIETGVIPVLVSLCKSDKLKLMLPAIRVIGNVSSGNELQTE